MNLKSPAFEKTLRRLVRQEVRRSPALKRERKRIGRKRRTTSSAAFWLSLAFLAFLFLFASFSRSPELAGGLLALLATALLCGHIGRLRANLFSDLALPILDGLPLTSEQVFCHQWRRFARGTIWVAVYFTLAYLCFGLYAAFGPAQFAGAILAAVLQWLLVYAASMLLLSRKPGWRFETAAVLLCSLLTPLYFAGVVLGERLLLVLEPFVRVFSWITPAGWLNSLFLHGVVRGDLLWFALVIPVALLAATVPSSRRRLEEMHRAREPVCFRWPVVTAEEAKIAALLGVPLPTRAGATEIEDNSRARRLLVEPAWPKAGLLERWVARWLSPRETAVAAFVYLYPPGWTVTWKAAVKTLLIVLPLSLVVARLGYGLFLAVFGVGTAIIAFLVLPVSDLFWRGFHNTQVGAVGTPVHAYFPFSYGEIARVFFKASAVRALASLPLLAILGAFGAWQNSEQAAWGARLGCHVALLYLCLNPVLVTLSFSNQTSDYKFTGPISFLFSTTFVLGILLVGLLTFVQAGVLLMNKGFIGPLILPLIIGLISYALYRWHRFAYDRCWFDTLKIAR